MDSGQLYMCLRAQEPSWDHQGQVSAIATLCSLTVGKPHKDSEVRLAVELGGRVCLLQEQFPGKPMGGMCQNQAQSSCQLWPRQLLDGKLAGANKAIAASQPAPQR